MDLLNLTSITNSDLILLATGVIVWIYTSAAQKANELQEKPVLEFGFEESADNGGSPTGDLYVKNIGRGPAYSISFGNFSLNENGRGNFNYQFFLRNPTLQVGERKSLRMWIKTPENGLEASDERRLLFRMSPPHTPADPHGSTLRTPVAVFSANYQGLSGNFYHSVFHFYNILPPVGNMIMQFIKHGKGKVSIETARQLCGSTEVIVHPG